MPQSRRLSSCPDQGSGAMDSPATIERQLHLAVERRTQALDELFQAFMLIMSIDARIDVLLDRKSSADA